MRAFEVEVYTGGGGDRDEIGMYLVWAMTAEQAEEIALEHATPSLGAEAKSLNFPEKVNELDYDGVLGWSPFRHTEVADAKDGE